MTPAGSNAAAAQARQPAHAGHGAPDPAQVSRDAAAGQAGQSRQSAAVWPVPPEPVPPEPVLPEPMLPEPMLPEPMLPEPMLPEPILPEQSREDTDIAWGDYRSRDDEDRDRLYRDRPPHWADY